MLKQRYFATACNRRLSRGSRSFILPASRFPDILNCGGGRIAEYEGTPFADMNAKLRGDLLSNIVRMSVVNGEEAARITDAEPGLCHGGRRRGASNAEYDWLCNGRRVECKSSMLRWIAYYRTWGFRFQSVKFHYFDILLLVLYTPLELIVYQHDFELGVSSAGSRTETDGYHISLYGPKYEADWNVALQYVLGKLDAPSNKCRRVARLSLQHPEVVRVLQSFESSSYASLMSRAYHEVPLAFMSVGVRGTRIQAIARLIYSIMNMGSSVMDPVAGVRINGARRSMAQAEYDWSRDGQRIECKSSQLAWDSHNHRWRHRFHGIKSVSFDELQLCFYTPRGIFIYLHDGRFALSSNGVRSETHGCQISMVGNVHEQDWSVALDTILKKFDSSPCKYLGLIQW